MVQEVVKRAAAEDDDNGDDDDDRSRLMMPMGARIWEEAGQEAAAGGRNWSSTMGAADMADMAAEDASI
jgi:hypothetical protein